MSASPSRIGPFQIQNRTLRLAFRFFLVAILVVTLYVEFSSKPNLPEIWSTFYRNILQANPVWLIAAVLLMPANWLAEMFKWYPVLRRYDPITPGQAFRAVLAGVSFSIFTPNRIGEYGGRLLYVQPENYWKAVITNLVGSFSQYMVLVTAGVIGALYYLPARAGIDPLYIRALGIAAVSGLIVMYLVYFNLSLALPLAKKLPLARYFKRYAGDIRVLEQFHRSELSNILQWSFIRYAIYSTQYYLIIRFFDIQVDIYHGFAAIATIYLIQTCIPLPPIAGLMARGNLAVHFWSDFGANDISSLAASFTLWIINLVFPALIGTFLLFYVNITKQLGYEDD